MSISLHSQKITWLSYDSYNSAMSGPTIKLFTFLESNYSGEMKQINSDKILPIFYMFLTQKAKNRLSKLLVGTKQMPLVPKQ